jgi:hypothetical protein
MSDGRWGGRLGDLFPVHPQPLPDELLTSWLIRTAHGNGMKLQRLLDVAVGRNMPTLNRDYDRSAPYAHLEQYAELTGIGVQRLAECTLRSASGTFVDEVNIVSNSPWILVIGVHHRKRKLFGQQYCPACLATDFTPHFRRSWRFAFYVECHIHHIAMCDACWACGAQVIPHRIDVGQRQRFTQQTMRYCHRCGDDLAHAPQYGLEIADIEVAVRLRSLTLLHWWRFSIADNNQSQTMADDFVDLRNLCHVLRSRRRYLNRLGPAVRSLLEKKETAIEDRPTFTIEHARIQERIVVLAEGLWLLCDWPQRLEQALRLARMTKRRLLISYANWSPRMRHALTQ